MKQLCLTAALLLGITTIVPAADKEVQRASLQAVSDIFLSGNHKLGMTWFSKKAVRKRGKAGSAYEQAERELKDLPKGLRVKSVQFVRAGDFASAADRKRLAAGTFAGFFEADRLPKHIGNHTAVLVKLTQPTGDTVLWLCFVFKQTGKSYKIIYSDDN